MRHVVHGFDSSMKIDVSFAESYHRSVILLRHGRRS